jgi:Sortilin, neurotensin receptor 3,/IPT/TIG domain
MKKLLPCLTLVGLLVLALGGTAGAKPPTLASPAVAVTGTTATTAGPGWAAPADRVSPTVTAISPGSAPNDIGTSVVISGAGFTAVMSGTVVLTSPTASLGSTALTNVTFVNSTTLTATVPWGLNPGSYPLTVVNPDGGTGTLTGAFSVTPGIGQWNGGNLFGGDVHQLLMKPGDPNTLYAPAYGLAGLFRSTDAGETWKYVGADLFLGNYKLAVDNLHPDWLYAYTYAGVERSTDEGDTWNTLLPTWPDGRPMDHGQVYPSPYDSQVVFVSSYVETFNAGSAGDAQGLIRSTNGGASWTIVSSLAGVSVQDVAFDPNDPTHSQMVAVTQDARVYHSGDRGVTWNQVASPPGVTSIGFNEQLAYNPYKSGEVWIVSYAPDKVFKSTDAALSNWQDVTPTYIGGPHITFTGADSVYVPWMHSSVGGAPWNPFGPVTGIGSLLFDPNNSQIGYVGDRTYGVQKTVDGGLTWQVKDQGLAGMTCSSMDVSRSDALRVYATFGNWSGVYRSLDGAGTWGYVQVPGSYPIMSRVRTDPTDATRVYALSHDGIYRSTDGGASWTDLGFVTSAPAPSGALWVMQPDPLRPGHLLVALDTGDYLSGPGYLYASSDYGVSWQAVAMPQPLSRISDIAFDPQTPGLVYIATAVWGTGTNGTGVYRSTDGGVSWTRIDDLKQPDMRSANTIAIATHPQHMLFVATQQGDYRSIDGGTTWRKTQSSQGSYNLFADSDSTRLYAGASDGLYFSSDGGDTWTHAAGAFGQLQITALGCAVAQGHTIIYAATNGGQAAASSGMAARTPGTARATSNAMVDAGIYRYVVVTPKLSLKLSGLKKGVLKLGRRLTAKGVVTPSVLAGNKVRFVLQKKVGKWRAVKTVTLTIKRGGACSWTYKPAKRGAYRLQVTIAKTATHGAATTKWLSLKVK